MNARRAEIGQAGVVEESTEVVQPEWEITLPTPRESHMGNGEASEDDVVEMLGNVGEDMEEDRSLPQTPGEQKRKHEDPQNDPGTHLRRRSPTVS